MRKNVKLPRSYAALLRKKKLFDHIVMDTPKFSFSVDVVFTELVNRVSVAVPKTLEVNSEDQDNFYSLSKTHNTRSLKAGVMGILKGTVVRCGWTFTFEIRYLVFDLKLFGQPGRKMQFGLPDLYVPNKKKYTAKLEINPTAELNVLVGSNYSAVEIGEVKLTQLIGSFHQTTRCHEQFMKTMLDDLHF